MKFTPDTLIKLLHDRIETSDQSSGNLYFTVQITNDEDKVTMPIIVKGKGVENFNAAIETAKGYNPDTLLIQLYKTQKTTERPEKHTIRLSETNPEQDREKAETAQKLMIETSIQEGLAGLKENMQIDEDTTGLGLITERFKHTGEKLQWENEKQMLQLKHDRAIEDLNRTLLEKEQQKAEDEEYITELETENKTLTKNYEELEENRFSLQGMDLRKVGGEVGANILSSFVKNNMSAVSKLSGLPVEALEQAFTGDAQAPSGAGSKASMVEDDNPQMEQVITQIRQMLSTFDQAEMEKFFQLLGIIANDKENLDIILNVVNPKRG